MGIVWSLPKTELGQTERNILAVFERHGRDGGAITMEGLAAHTGLSVGPPEFARAVKSLLARGCISASEQDVHRSKAVLA